MKAVEVCDKCEFELSNPKFGQIIELLNAKTLETMASMDQEYNQLFLL